MVFRELVNILLLLKDVDRHILEVMLFQQQVTCNVKFKKHLITYTVDTIKLYMEIMIQLFLGSMVNIHLIQDFIFKKQLLKILHGIKNKLNYLIIFLDYKYNVRKVILYLIFLKIHLLLLFHLNQM